MIGLAGEISYYSVSFLEIEPVFLHRVSVEAIGLFEIGIIIAAYLVVGSAVFSWALRSRKKAAAPSRTVDEIKHHIVMLVWMLVLIFFVYVGGGFLAHQDASWYQLAHSRDEIMPARLITYLILYPAYTIVGGAAWLHARINFGDRQFSCKLKSALILATFIPFLFLPADNPDAMGFSVDFINSLLRAGYGLAMFLWLAAVAYIVGRQGLAILVLLKRGRD